MRFISMVVATLLSTTASPAQSGSTILFVGNSFTYGAGSPVQFYRGSSVTDLNNGGLGGVPALFKSFATQAGLNYDVSLETEPGSGLEFHLNNRRALIDRRWDTVVMHGQSTLDFDKPRDPGKLIATTRQMADLVRKNNPNVRIYLTSTWSRADQTYKPGGAWAGKPIEAMADDVRAAYNQAAAAPGVVAVIPVGQAWSRAMHTGVADPNPYDGIEFGKMDLWTTDQYHASTYGYYLEALLVFGAVTGRDPRSLGDTECSGFELGVNRSQIKSLQQVAFDQLASEGKVTAAVASATTPRSPVRCGPGR